jgi:hypothetical protein
MRWVFSMYLILSAALGPGVYSNVTEMSTESNKIMLLGSRARSVRRADNLTAMSANKIPKPEKMDVLVLMQGRRRRE